MLARAATVPITVRFIALPQSNSGLPQGHDVDIDSGPSREPRHPHDDRASADQLPPAAALAGAYDDVGDLLTLSVIDQGADQVVRIEVVPRSAHLGRHVPQPGQAVVATSADRVLLVT